MQKPARSKGDFTKEKYFDYLLSALDKLRGRYGRFRAVSKKTICSQRICVQSVSQFLRRVHFFHLVNVGIFRTGVLNAFVRTNEICTYSAQSDSVRRATCDVRRATCDVRRIPFRVILQKIQFQNRKYFWSAEVCLSATVLVHSGDCYVLFVSSVA